MTDPHRPASPALDGPALDGPVTAAPALDGPAPNGRVLDGSLADAAVSALRCPVCRSPLATGNDVGTGLVCSSGHRFDAARQGYINLLTGKGTDFTPDTAAMVAARQDFLEGGHYAPVTDALRRRAAERLTGRTSPCILDAGAGTGHYLGRVAEALPNSRAIGMDISKYAVRRLPRNAPHALALVWDVWRTLPIADSSIDLILNIFAPRNSTEFARVLRPDGVLAVVTPLPEHLAQLRTAVGMLDVDTAKSARLTDGLAPDFVPIESQDLRFTLHLDPADAVRAVMMGPSAHHLERAAVERAVGTGTKRLDVDAAVRLSLFRPA